MNPFERYPNRGRVLLGRRTGANARHEYGLRLQRITGQSFCTYCGLDLVSDYAHWLLLAVDPVVPAKVAKRLGISAEFSEDLINLVLSCAACNGFDNRFRVDRDPQPTWTVDGFADLRDHVFAERRPRIAACHERERRLFESKAWRQEQTPAMGRR